MLTLKDETKAGIGKILGRSVAEISLMSASEIDEVIEVKIKKKINVAHPLELGSRGCVYLSLKRLSQTSSIDNLLKKI